MRKTVFAINSTVDGYCNHTDMIADDELHEYFRELLRHTDVILIGRKTYELMVPYWPDVAKSQSGTPADNEFARVFDALEKVVFSTTLKSVEGDNTKIVRANIAEEVLKLKQRPGKGIAIGSLSIASQLSERGLLDEFHFCVQPFVVGTGPRLFETANLKEKLQMNLVGSKTFRSGVIALHYKKQ